MSTLQIFLAGTLCMGFTVCALYFLRFWGRTKDKLFLAFAACFLLLGTGQALTVLLGLPEEERTWIYLLRLTGFMIVIAALLGKNLKR